MTEFLQTVVSGVSLSVVYVMLSLGVALVFGVLGLVNFAQGDFMTLAAYVGLTAVTSWGLHPLVATAVMVPVLLVVGVVFYYAIVVPTRNRSHEVQFIATFGVAFVLQGLVTLHWGATPRTIQRDLHAYQLHGVTVPHETLTQVAVTAVALLLLWGFMSGTRIGREIRATAIDRTGAELMGIDTGRARLAAVLVSCVLTAGAGYMILTTAALTPTVGFSLVFSAFAVVVLAGLGSLGGAVVASLLLGLATAFTGSYLSTSATDAVPFVVIFFVLVVRPAGLRGKVAT
ncbi:MAG: branched-chain amino acid ABC transporter permease [Nocardioides sp.]